MELAAQIPPEQRATTPLFGPAPGEEFTHSQLDLALQLLLIAGGYVTEEQLQRGQQKYGTVAEVSAALDHKNTRVTTIYLDHVNTTSVDALFDKVGDLFEEDG